MSSAHSSPPAFIATPTLPTAAHRPALRPSHLTHPRMSARSRAARLLITGTTLTTVSSVLGPLLDNYHSQFHVLSYTHPLTLHYPIEIATSPLTPPLFVTAGLTIGFGTLLINARHPAKHISIPHAFATIAAFSAVYYLSASLPDTPAAHFLGPLLCALAALEWWVLDRSVGGGIMGLAAAVAGPVVEIILIKGGLYSYAQPEWMGVPLFIVPVYFAGGPAVGNLARAVWAYPGAVES